MKVIDCFTFYNELDRLKFRLKQIKNNKDLYGRSECIFKFIDIKDNNYLPKNYKDLLKFTFNE